MDFAVSTNSGLQEFAAQEAKRRLGATTVRTSQSFARFQSQSSPSELLKLRIAEHVYVGVSLVDESVTAQFRERSPSECMDAIADSITPAAWELAVQAWQQATGQDIANPTFRASCKRIGGRSKHMRSPDIAANVGISIRDRFGCRVSLKHHDMEVYIRVEDTFVFVGISLNDSRLTDRQDVVAEGLRGSAAHALAMLANPRAGDIVLDPMCGKGALLFESHQLCSDAVYLGADMSNSQLRAAAQNAIGTHSASRVSFIKGDARCLPLETASVDRILCDLPFGKKYGTAKDNRALYPAVIAECARVIRPGGRAVLLTSRKQLHTLQAALTSHDKQLRLCEEHRLKLGNTDSIVVVADAMPQQAVQPSGTQPAPSSAREISAKRSVHRAVRSQQQGTPTLRCEAEGAAPVKRPKMTLADGKQAGSVAIRRNGSEQRVMEAKKQQTQSEGEAASPTMWDNVRAIAGCALS